MKKFYKDKDFDITVETEIDEDKEFGFASEEDLKQLIANEKLLQKNPDDIDALLKKGILFYEPFLRTNTSIAILKSVIAKDPKNVDAYFWLAKCIWHYKFDFLEAERLLRIALTIDPNRADCHLWLAIVLEDVVEIHFRKAIELEPTWIEPRRCLARYFFRKGNFSFAREQVVEALEYAIDDDKMPKINDAIVDHYEMLVTGRYYPNTKSMLLDFLKRIDEAIEQGEIEDKKRRASYASKKKD